LSSQRATAGGVRGAVTCRSTGLGRGGRGGPSADEKLQVLRRELDQARKAMALLEEGMRTIFDEEGGEAVTTRNSLAEEARGTFSLKRKEFDPKEWPRNEDDLRASLALARRETSLERAELELEVERLQVESVRVDALEEKIRALEVSAAAREKELLLVIAEKERTITSMDQIITDQEKFVAEVRRMEIMQATNGDVVYDSRVPDLEARLLDMQATVAEVQSEKEALEKKMEELQSTAPSAPQAAGGRDPLLPAVDKQSEVVEILHKQLEDREAAIAQLQAELETANVGGDFEESIREDKLNGYVAKVRALEIEMASMTHAHESDQLAKEVMEYKMRCAELEQELEGRKGQAEQAPPTKEKKAPPKKAAAKKAPSKKALSKKKTEALNGSPRETSAFLRNGFTLRKKDFIPKKWPREGSMKLTGGAEEVQEVSRSTSNGTFVLKGKDFTPKKWPRDNGAGSLEKSLNDKLNKHVARIRALEIEMSHMATIQESDDLARELTEAKLTIHQLQMELELVRLSALNPTPAEPVPSPPEDAAAEKVEPKGFRRGSPGGFVLRKKLFVPKSLSRPTGFKRNGRGSFILRSKQFVPKSLSRSAGFKRNSPGSYVLKKKEFTKKPWSTWSSKEDEGFKFLKHVL